MGVSNEGKSPLDLAESNTFSTGPQIVALLVKHTEKMEALRPPDEKKIRLSKDGRPSIQGR